MKKVKILALCGFLALAGCGKKKEAEPQKGDEKAARAVEAVQIGKSELTMDVNASGTAAGIREAYVVSETPGTIREVHFKLGQKVSAGQLLVEVDSDMQKAAYKSAKNMAEAANMNLKVTQKLFDEGSVSEVELKTSINQAAGAEAQLESARKAYENCRITSPVSGYIAQKDASLETGNLVSPGTMIARVVDLKSLKAIVGVGEQEVSLLKKGMKADVRVPVLGDRILNGKITGIAAGADPATGSFPVEVVWKNTRDLKVKSGMSVRVRMITRTPEQVILVPGEAVIEKDRKDAVFVSIQDKAAIQFVTLGRSSGNQIEVTEGLKVKDILIVTGMTELGRGDPVAVTLRNSDGGK